MKPKCKLVGIDGNAYAVMSAVKKALTSAGMQDKIKPFLREAMSGDYVNLLRVVHDYVDVE